MGSWFQGLRKTRDRFAAALKEAFAAPTPDVATAEELADLLITADVPLRLVHSLSSELEQAASRREPLALELRKAVPQLRAADVQSLGKHAFRRQFSRVPVGAFLDFAQQPASHALQRNGFAHPFAPPCRTNWYYLFVLPI